MTRSAILLATLLAACATSPASDDPTGDGKADGDGASIRFDDGFGETLRGSLVAGGSVRIDYDLDRMTTCRGYTNGSDAWGVSGYAQFDDDAPVAFEASRIANGTTVAVSSDVAIPATAKKVAFWFEQTDVFGCHAYDSNSSANYTYAITAHTGGAVLDFPADYSATASGAIHGGDKVVVHYDPSRLAECEGSTGGHLAWGITGHYQVDGGSVHDLGGLVSSDASFTVPHGSDLAVWFEATNIWGCHAYDSNSGANYHFDVE